MGPLFGQVFIIGFASLIIGKTDDLDAFYTRAGQDLSVSLQRVGIVHQVSVEFELDVVDHQGIGSDGRRRSVRGSGVIGLRTIAGGSIRARYAGRPVGGLPAAV